MKKQNFLLILAVGVFTLNACVSSKKFEEVSKQKADCETERDRQKKEVLRLQAENSDLAVRLTNFAENLLKLNKDTTDMGSSLRSLRSDNARMKKDLEEFESYAESRISATKGETAKALQELRDKETQLRKLEDELNTKRAALEQLSQELRNREQRVQELEKVINDQKAAVAELKERISRALKGFADSGLKVEERNGKVYVSMDEKLLFESGKTDVQENGRKALAELGKVLERDKDLNVMIEGHTDNVPLSGTGFMKDNWDLSVLRGTAIARILLQNKGIEPIRITVAGRGEYVPVADNETKEGRAKNRRTEIIITPKLSEIFKILQSN